MSVRRLLGGALAFLVAGAVVVPATTTAASGATPAPDRTSAVEARRVDSLPVPKITWFDCSVITPRGACGTVRLPVDYDQPKGATTEVALFRVKVADPKKKIGTLFLNPGGPGGSGVQFAAAAPFFLAPDVLAKFDIVGVDPRGTNFSDNVRCFKDLGAQAKALSGLNTPFPTTATQREAYIKSAMAFGKTCSTAGQPLVSSMSTAEVARDMDVLRRTFGDTKLSYLGFSYGTYLGQVYANMFPDRVRAVAIDGVLDPVAWSGSQGATPEPQTQRLKSGEGAYRALVKILDLCKTSGPDFCNLAAMGDPRTLFNQAMADLRANPIVISDPETGEVFFTLDYATATAMLLGDLYSPDGSMFVDWDLSSIVSITQDPMARKAATRRAAAALQARAETKAAADRAAKVKLAKAGARAGWGFPYDNSPEAFQSVLCSDGTNPSSARLWPYFTATAQRNAPGFGPLWSWASAPCASSTWTATDEDAYRGPFTKRTANPVLVVGNYWDPATNYAGAVKASTLLPNSRLVSSNSWGHTAYGTSECVTKAVDTYLLTAAVPPVGTRCVGDQQPFTDPIEQPQEQLRQSGTSRILPPVVAPVQGALPRL
ncbi:alpha/beta hydrolase [Phycicoccus sp. Root101]|uniref:alpha/beta hydrolase n=1 Tax=Phycicoccus sp. Root101 TaxID=1736421 RepID=UPI0007031B38|nr:alpha/beta hydrolase [Phycicoccus sp. Root101]KQU66525.1 transporter [Phycicoccus sp. Root101]